jgi:protocatechuate 3,4-dioxygenase beta subunit
MNRKNFLNSIGLIGLSPLVSLAKKRRDDSLFNQLVNPQSPACVLIPQETAGPYPLDLSQNSAMFRQDITEGKAGLPMNLKLTVVNINDNCKPMPDLRIDVWHCDKDGYYSGYTNSGYLGNQNNAGKTFCRGIQITNSIGEVFFKTIYPGWYMGRVQHIHFQVFVNSRLTATSQLCFPEDENTYVNNQPGYSAHGQNSTKNTNDNVFSDGIQYQLTTLSKDPNTGEYNGELIIGINAAVTATADTDPDTGGQFVLYPNNPNPWMDETNIVFELKESANTVLDLFDIHGKKWFTFLQTDLQKGIHEVRIGESIAKDLTAGNYVIHLRVENQFGLFTKAKLITKI